MRPSRLRLAGWILLAAGLVGSLGFGLLLIRTHLEGIFGSLVSDNPSQKLQELNCPLFLSYGERATVTAAILNPTAQDLAYRVHVETRRMEAEPVLIPAVMRVPGGQSLRYAWEVTALGNGNGILVVQAVSDIDFALPGPFHLWPTSYRQSCGILVLPPPWTGWLVIGGCLACLMGGAGLVVFSRAPRPIT